MELIEAVSGHAIVWLSHDELLIIINTLGLLPEIEHWENKEILTQEEVLERKDLLSEINVVWDQLKYLNEY